MNALTNTLPIRKNVKLISMGTALRYKRMFDHRRAAL